MSKANPSAHSSIGGGPSGEASKRSQGGIVRRWDDIDAWPRFDDHGGILPDEG